MMAADSVRYHFAPLQSGEVEGSLYHYIACRRDGTGQGTAIIMIKDEGKETGEEGVYVTATHIGASDAYYQWHAARKNRGLPGALQYPNSFHFCRTSYDQCACKERVRCKECAHVADRHEIDKATACQVIERHRALAP